MNTDVVFKMTEGEGNVCTSKHIDHIERVVPIMYCTLIFPFFKNKYQRSEASLLVYSNVYINLLYPTLNTEGQTVWTLSSQIGFSIYMYMWYCL